MTLQKCLDLFRRTYIGMLQTLNLFLDIPLFLQYLLILRIAYQTNLMADGTQAQICVILSQ